MSVFARIAERARVRHVASANITLSDLTLYLLYVAGGELRGKERIEELLYPTALHRAGGPDEEEERKQAQFAVRYTLHSLRAANHIVTRPSADDITYGLTPLGQLRAKEVDAYTTEKDRVKIRNLVSTPQAGDEYVTSGAREPSMTHFSLGKEYEDILRMLVARKSMPFLEIAALSDIDDQRIAEIVRDLEQMNFVKISNPGDVYRETVTARERAFAVGT